MTKNKRKGAPPAELVGGVTLKGDALRSARVAFWTHAIQPLARNAHRMSADKAEDMKPKELRRALRARDYALGLLADGMETMNLLGGIGTPAKRVRLRGEHLRHVRRVAEAYVSQGQATGRRFDDSVRTGEGAWRMMRALFATRGKRKRKPS